VASGERDLDPQLLDAVDEVRTHPRDIADQADVRQARNQLLEHDADLGAGQQIAQAQVRAALAEGDVIVVLPGDVEVVGVAEDVLVTVAGGEPHDDLVAFLDPLAAEFDVPGGRPARGRSRRCRTGGAPTGGKGPEP
jgi:hypothetical protein